MKKILVFLTVAMATAGSLLNAAPPPSPQQAPATPYTPGCSQLPADQQSLAAQLTSQDNQIMFCTKFTPQQRQQAVQKMGKPNAGGSKTTADQAVEEIMAANGLLPPSQQPKPKTYGGACPVQ